MALTGLAAEVDPDQVHALLLARSPALLDPESDEHVLYEATVRQIVAEVIAITGPDPQDDEYRDLALATIALGVAAQLEFALFPEQQGLGDTGRGAALQARYEALLARLASSKLAAGELPTIAHPVGNFPTALSYPDPAERCCY